MNVTLHGIDWYSLYDGFSVIAVIYEVDGFFFSDSFISQALAMSIAMITTFPMVIGDWNKRIRRVHDVSGGRSNNEEIASF